MIFQYYDTSKDGRIDYKELSKIIEARHSDKASSLIQ